MELIAALGTGGLIGRAGGLPWTLPAEMRYFAQRTAGAAVIMGRNTWESIPPRFRPLRGRAANIVVSTAMDPAEGIVVCRTLEEAMERAQAYDAEAFIIGGAKLYAAALQHPALARMHISYIHGEFPPRAGDTLFPEVDWTQWKEVERNPALPGMRYEGFDAVTYERR